jgi:O-antigen/teichoic acid export membrane protein
MISKKPHSFVHAFLKGEAISAFWGFTTKGIGLLNTFLTITSLTLYQYGVFQLLLSVAGISSDALNLGSTVISNEMSRAIAEKRIGDAKKIFIEYSVIRLIIAFGIWAAVYFGATILFNSYSIDFIKDMRVISFLFITEAIFMIMRTFWLVKLEFGLVAIRSTINKFIQAGILVFFFAQGNLGLKQLIWSIIVASLGSVIVLVYSFLKSYFEWENYEMPKKILLTTIIINYGSWEIVRQFLNKITFRIKPWLIKLFISTEAVAVFSIAETIVTTLQDVIPSKTLQSLVPLWIEDKKLSAKMFSYGIKYFVLIGVVIGISSVIIVPPVVHGFFPKYNESLPLFYLMIFNLPVFASGIILGNYLVVLRKQKFLFAHNGIRNILTLGIILSTLPFVGLWGLAIEFVVVPFIMVMISTFYLEKLYPELRFDFDVLFSYSQIDRDLFKKILGIIKTSLPL